MTSTNYYMMINVQKKRSKKFMASFSFQQYGNDQTYIFIKKNIKNKVCHCQMYYGCLRNCKFCTITLNQSITNSTLNLIHVLLIKSIDTNYKEITIIIS